MSDPGCQSIFFATSADLVNWTRVPTKPAAPACPPPAGCGACGGAVVPNCSAPAPDPNVFRYGENYTIGGRWDCIATVPKPGAPGYFYGYWTATVGAVGRSGGAGVGETTDRTGRHWRALPPITDGDCVADPACGLPDAEVGSTVVLGDEYFMLYNGGQIYSSQHPTRGFKRPEAVTLDAHVSSCCLADGPVPSAAGPAITQGVAFPRMCTHIVCTYHPPCLNVRALTFVCVCFSRACALRERARSVGDDSAHSPVDGSWATLVLLGRWGRSSHLLCATLPSGSGHRSSAECLFLPD